MSLAPSTTTSPIGFATTRGALLPLVKALEKLTKPRHGRGIPIFQYVCLDADAGLIWATNYETTIAMEAPLTGHGRTLVRAATLAAAVKPGGTSVKALAMGVSVRTDGRTGVATVGPRQVPLGIHPEPEEYPQTPDIHTTSTEFRAAVGGGTLLAMWEATRFAAEKGSMVLPILNTVKVATTDNDITLLATDRYRLAEYRFASGHFREGPEMLVPLDFDQYLPLIKGRGQVSLSYDPTLRTMTVRAGQYTLTTRLIEGEFPRTQSIVEAPKTNRTDLDRDALIEAVRQVLPSVERNVPVKLAMWEGAATVKVNTDDGEVCSVPVPAHHAVGLGNVYGLDPHYLLDCLRALPAGTVSICTTEPTKPLRFESDLAPGLRIIQMPVRFAS